MSHSKPKLIGYWATTGLIALAIGVGGIFGLIRKPEMVAGITELGYPIYFVTILGFWKLAGAAALLVPRFPLLKEWAYAGIAFDLTGASASHAFAGHDAGKVIAPLVMAGLLVASWWLRPDSLKVRNKVTVDGKQDDAVYQHSATLAS